ncbi:MAG: hypothetical protein COV36_06265 [Alphaproteobacteria bacterium CG11_big_fil_rev_8_21_14_0_20_44_7]|nr:MAG: hypothetical protein COV36_06265 [Alphaproteobacteria bacterium CG11_big_fil_rev_8_21_14_0_20_44_7]
MFGFITKAKEASLPKKPASSTKAQRFNDGIIIVTQDNLAKTLKIEAANMTAIDMLGYPQELLIDHDLRDFLCDHAKEDIEEYIEFAQNGKNLDEVLKRTRRFRMKTHSGDVLPLRLRIIRSLSTHELPRFQLVLNDDSLIENIEQNREEYRNNLRGDEIFDAATGLIAKKSLVKDLEMVAFYSDKTGFESSIAMLKISNLDNITAKCGDVCRKETLKHVADKIVSNKREQDIVGVYEDGVFAIVLTETPSKNTAVPVNRLRRSLENNKFEITIDSKTHLIEIESNVEFRAICASEPVEDQLKSLAESL